MTNNFIEHLIARSTKKTTTLSITPALTPDVLPEIFQLLPNYKQQQYTKPLSQTNIITKKQVPSPPTNTPANPPKQSPQSYPQTQKPNIASQAIRDDNAGHSQPTYPQTQKPNTASQEPLNPPKSQLTNPTKEEPKHTPQTNGYEAPLSNAPKTYDSKAAPPAKNTPLTNKQTLSLDGVEAVVDQSSLSYVAEESSLDGVEAVVDKPSTSATFENEQTLSLSKNISNLSSPQANRVSSLIQKDAFKSQEPLNSYKQPPVNSPKNMVTFDQKITKPSLRVSESEVGAVLVDSTTENSVKDVTLYLPSETQNANSEVSKSTAISKVNSPYLGILRHDLESQDLLNSSKRQITDLAGEKINQTSQKGVSAPFLPETLPAESDPRTTEPPDRAVTNIVFDSKVENQNEPPLSANRQKTNPQSAEFTSPAMDRWNPLYPPTKEPMLKVQNSTQTKTTDQEPSLRVNPEQTHTKIEFEANPTNKATVQPSSDNVKNHSPNLKNAANPATENPPADGSEKFLELSLVPKLSRAPLDIAPNEVMSDDPINLNTDHSLMAPKKIVDTVSQPKKNIQPAAHLSQGALVSPQPPLPITITPPNLATQNTVGELRAKPPKPVLPVATPFSTKLQSPKETETIVTIHIGRIEVHAVRAPEPPVELPRAPVLSLSDYLRQRSEKN
ncbi:MAG: hypothetical protein LBH74_08280 [Nitrososphaerota archaeon]|jgi:hypothetical protein|nr:hypothetical protein [Nitrososphaerota archaeon]